MPEPRTKKQQSSFARLKKRAVIWVSLVVVLFLGVLVAVLLRDHSPPVIVSQPVVEQETEDRDVILYFAAADATQLVAEGRMLEACVEEQDCILTTVQALIAGPVGRLTPVLTAQATVLAVRIDGALVEVDFDHELVSSHAGGTQGELLSVYALANTLAANFPHLRQVRILIDGQPIDTLKGHVDLRQPVTADFSLVDEETAPTGNLGSLPTQE